LSQKIGRKNDEVYMDIKTISDVSSASSSATVLALSNKISSSGKTGKGGGGGEGGKVQSSSSSSSSAESSTVYDKMDLNKDGKVSASEKALYLMMHPDEAETENSSQGYTSQGKQDEFAGGFSGIINLSA
jgi:hypothetical protein